MHDQKGDEFNEDGFVLRFLVAVALALVASLSLLAALFIASL